MGVHVHSVHRGLTSIAEGVVRVERLSVFLPAMRHSICCCSLRRVQQHLWKGGTARKPVRAPVTATTPVAGVRPALEDNNIKILVLGGLEEDAGDEKRCPADA